MMTIVLLLFVGLALFALPSFKLTASEAVSRSAVWATALMVVGIHVGWAAVVVALIGAALRSGGLL